VKALPNSWVTCRLVQVTQTGRQMSHEVLVIRNTVNTYIMFFSVHRPSPVLLHQNVSYRLRKP